MESRTARVCRRWRGMYFSAVVGDNRLFRLRRFCSSGGGASRVESRPHADTSGRCRRARRSRNRLGQRRVTSAQTLQAPLPVTQALPLYVVTAPDATIRRSPTRAPSRDTLRSFPPETILAAITTGKMVVQASALSEDQKRTLAVYLAGRPYGNPSAGEAKNMPNRCGATTVADAHATRAIGATGATGTAGAPIRATRAISRRRASRPLMFPS